MATNDFIGFASNGSANIMSQADYAAAIEQGDGVQPGMASSALANKVWRQGANMAAALGRITAARGYDALDNGDLDALQSSVDDAISAGTFNRMFFSQTSGSYTAPRTGIYRITLKGGGGGGGGGKTGNTNVSLVGAGGGEGAKMIFYDRLIKNTSYAYTIGAGGAAGTNASSNSDITPGANGGNTTIVTNGNTFSVSGGGGGFKATSSQIGGVGGNVFVSVGTTYKIPGIPGESGWSGTGGQGGHGGGSGGAYSATNVTQNGTLGGGGMGAPFNASVSAGNGGDGFILIEYAE